MRARTPSILLAVAFAFVALSTPSAATIIPNGYFVTAIHQETRATFDGFAYASLDGDEITLWLFADDEEIVLTFDVAIVITTTSTPVGPARTERWDGAHVDFDAAWVEDQVVLVNPGSGGGTIGPFVVTVERHT